ncbi:cytochrome c1 [Terrarubrum flagellatum]|uniref:cytochrome c1 n=1 Tax=Terrirubrum flagellatum TaxID=2895980 RepID=UPI003144D4CE
MSINKLFAAAALFIAVSAPAFAQEHGAPEPPQQSWSFSGPFGKFDRAQLQRGFKVYREVCSTCHSLQLVSFRNLEQEGGPEFSEAQVKALAAEYKIATTDDNGQPTERPGMPSDTFPLVYPNEKAARATNGGALPPDMSLLAKARTYERGFPRFIFDIFTQYQEQGPDYIVGILTGYEEAPKDVKLQPGQFYNKYMPGHLISMRPPLENGRVEYPKMPDGKPQAPETTEQYAKDVVTFLVWAAEPHLEARKSLGLRVMLFLIVFAGLLYFTKKRVWASAHDPAHA